MFNNLLRKFYVLDPVVLNPGAGGDSIGTDNVGGVNYEVVKQAFGPVGTVTLVDPSAPLPVTDAAAEAALASIAAEDFATQTTLAAINLKLGGKSSIGTSSNVNDSASNVTLLSANALRLGATVFNDSTEVLYLKLGATASLTSFTAKMNPNAYYEVPFQYTGIIDGIWANNAAGAARLTELTV